MTAKRWALITGGSGGIGLELAKLAAADGYSLILVAREAAALERAADELKDVYTVQIETVELDLGAPGAAARLISQLGNRKVDMLINNAGFATHGAVAAMDPAELTREVGVNILALTELTRLLMPAMITRKSGYILNLASTAAFLPGPFMAVYYATKAYVLSFSVAVANEAAPFGVTVTALCPGPTQTGFAARAHLEQSRLFRGRLMDAKTVALAGYIGLMQGKVIVVPGIVNRINTWGVRLLPRAVAARVARRIQE